MLAGVKFKIENKPFWELYALERGFLTVGALARFCMQQYLNKYEPKKAATIAAHTSQQPEEDLSGKQPMKRKYCRKRMERYRKYVSKYYARRNRAITRKRM